MSTAKRLTPNKIANLVMADEAWHDSEYVAASDYDALSAELAALRDKALQFDLDQAGIARREADATELIELRAELAALRAERKKLLGCRDDLREIAEAINRLTD